MGSKRAKYYLCSKHFNDSMFEGNFMKQLLPPNFMKRQTRQRLKKNALPTKFSHTQNKERSSSSLRIAAQERKKLLDELLSTQPSTSDTVMQEMDDNHAQTELLLQDKVKDMMKEVEVTVGNNVDAPVFHEETIGFQMEISINDSECVQELRKQMPMSLGREVTYKNRYWTDFALLAFQFALAWKYGGTFIGTRYISMNPILEQDFVLQKKDLLISNKVFGFTAHNQFVWNCMEDLILHYDRAVWGQHSPNVLTREVNILCDKSAVYLHNRQDSLCDAYNIKLFHHLDFCSISYKTSNLLNHSVTNSFQNQTENDDRQHSTLPVLNKWEDLCLKEYSPIFYRVFMRKKRN
ncbi:uncharacterized protein LOC122811985 isoform X1 [Protopterus annectens]|uniref:uncharacterized protein LOC122811985 isoform X1 n=1 Tax=Protopterus annectens TaxID=7888 RepID=UPI001CF97B0F|nr:uncharacterized protein LOC122811985 isoform X1 [Protopterus annectens]